MFCDQSQPSSAQEPVQAEKAFIRAPRCGLACPTGRSLLVSIWRSVRFEVSIHFKDADPGRLSPKRRRRMRVPGFGKAFRAAAAFLLLSFFLCATGFAGDINFEHWRWSNPLPHGNNVLDMLVAGQVAVQVGDGGRVYLQREDERWAPAITGVTNYLRGVAMMGNRYIVVGESGCILWSDDGKAFQGAQLSPATDDWFEGVAASDQRAVAVGDWGSIYTSTNGVNWTKAVSNTDEWLRGVAFGGNAFVAVGENGTILRSGSTASSWTKVTSGTLVHLNRVRYFGTGASGQFIAVGNAGAALSSATGTAPWSSMSTGSTNNLFDVARNDKGTLLVGDQELRFRAAGETTWTNYVLDLSTNAPPGWVYLSACGSSNYWLVAGRSGLLLEGMLTNGASDYSWSPVPDSSHAWLWDLTIQRGIYVAAGDLATIQTSLDGILWAREVVPLPPTNVVLLGVGGTTNLLLAAGNGGNVLISRAGLTNVTITNYVGTNIVVTNTITDTFGLVWTNLPFFTTNTLQGVAASAGLFVLSGDQGSIFTSTDGSNFTARVTPTTNFLSGIAAGPDGWVAVGDRGTLLHSGPDAASWTKIALGTTNWLYRVRHVGDRFVAVGQNGAIFSSENGTDWSPRSSGTTRWLNDVTFLNGQWLAVGNQGELLSSSNLVNWSTVPLPTVKSLYGAASQNGQLVLAGVEGAILRNQVVSPSAPVDFLGYSRTVAVDQYGQSGTNTTLSAFEIFLFGGLPDQFFQFQSSTNLVPDSWTSLATLEMYDPSGTLYLLRTRYLTNTPPREFYRTSLVP